VTLALGAKPANGGTTGAWRVLEGAGGGLSPRRGACGQAHLQDGVREVARRGRSGQLTGEQFPNTAIDRPSPACMAKALTASP
jgi:hypothetical protein